VRILEIIRKEKEEEGYELPRIGERRGEKKSRSSLLTDHWKKGLFDIKHVEESLREVQAAFRKGKRKKKKGRNPLEKEGRKRLSLHSSIRKNEESHFHRLLYIGGGETGETFPQQ